MLINGQRLSGKSNDVLTELGRIPASNVVRIEIVDAATLDIPGLSGQIANVFVKAGGMSGQCSLAARISRSALHQAAAHARRGVGERQDGKFDYKVGLQNNGCQSGAGGPTLIYAADRRSIERRDDVWTGSDDSPRQRPVNLGRARSSVGNLNASSARLLLRLSRARHPHRARLIGPSRASATSAGRWITRSAATMSSPWRAAG